jgi:hypothetical protein
MRRHIDPVKFLEQGLVRPGPFAVLGRGVLLHAVVEADAVRENLFRLSSALSPDGEARKILVTFVDSGIGKGHRVQNLVVAGIGDHQQALVFLVNIDSFRETPSVHATCIRVVEKSAAVKSIKSIGLTRNSESNRSWMTGSGTRNLRKQFVTLSGSFRANNRPIVDAAVLMTIDVWDCITPLNCEVVPRSAWRAQRPANFLHELR